MNKILLVDHNDSFTYNVVALIRSVSNHLPTVISVADVDFEIIDKHDKIILSPGPGMPKEYQKTYKIIEKYADCKPILGICLGHQIIADFYGAKLVNLEKVVHGQTKHIKQVTSSIIYQDIPKRFEVGLYHSWAVDTHNFPDNLQVTALSDEGIIMSLQHPEYHLFGVQFHPESFMTEMGKQLMLNFINI